MTAAHALIPAEPSPPDDAKPGRQRRALGPWARFALRRLAGLVTLTIVLVTGTFLMVQLIPGDPARVLAGPDASGEEIERLRRTLGLDKPMVSQFADYVGGLAHGDLGRSFHTRESVTDIIATRMPFTAQLALAAMVVVLLVAVPLGMAVAVRRSRRVDGVFTFSTGLLGSVPEYVIATLLVLIFAITLRVLPATGAATPASLILPIVAIALPSVCFMARVVRREAGTVLEQDYIRAARGRRLPPWSLYLRHVLPNLLTATLTLSGLMLASLLGGTVAVEAVFSWPGIGLRVVDAVLARDYPVIQGCVLVLGLLAALLNLLVDVTLAVLDPRATLDGGDH
ncbi:ABC transporter permease [Nocardia fluminea]